MIQVNKKNIQILKDLIYKNSDLFIYKTNNEFFISDSKNKTKDPYALIPKFDLFKNNEFTKRYNIKYPYIAGAMAKQIASCETVTQAFKAGCFGNFGSAGLSNEKIIENAKKLKAQNINFGINIINIPGNQENELQLLKELINIDVKIISAGAYIRMTPGLVYYRVKGIKKDFNNDIIIKNKILAKISRKEIAKTFLSPPPKKIINKLLEQNLITNEEAQLSQYIPMSSDIIAEADSGGHTDKQPAVSLFPEILFLKQSFQKNYPSIKLCAGLAGGISCPYSASAAFSMGADFIVTGSINQSCIEAGTSDIVKEMLSKANQGDFELAPSADTFELGGKVQILKKGTKFGSRAKFLEKLYNSHSSIEDISQTDIEFLENKIFLKPIDQEWELTKKFFLDHNPKQIELANENPKKKMALIFKSYLGQSSSWAVTGKTERKEDFQIWSGPSMAVFNSWVKDTYLEDFKQRKTADIALNIIKGAVYLARVNTLSNLGINIPDNLKIIKPVKQI